MKIQPFPSRSIDSIDQSTTTRRIRSFLNALFNPTLKAKRLVPSVKKNASLGTIRKILSWSATICVFMLVFQPGQAWASEATGITTTETTIASVAPSLCAPPQATTAFKSIVPPVNGKTELRLVGRLLFAAVAGSVVGWERHSSKHSAGVRTMALVSLGAAAFTICSAYGFTGDPSRMAANVASGVGFLGAGVITTQARVSNDESYSIVHGLTTAAAIWLSAALGVASGVGMYLTSGATALTTVAILRLGKPLHLKKDEKRSMRTNSRMKNIAQYHPSDTHDTIDWDEHHLDGPPPLMGDSPKESSNGWLLRQFDNDTSVVMESVMVNDLIEAANFTSANSSSPYY